MTKWKIKRLDNVSGKLNFSWEQYDNNKDARWDWEKMELAVKDLNIGEEKIIEIL